MLKGQGWDILFFILRNNHPTIYRIFSLYLICTHSHNQTPLLYYNMFQHSLNLTQFARNRIVPPIHFVEFTVINSENIDLQHRMNWWHTPTSRRSFGRKKCQKKNKNTFCKFFCYVNVSTYRTHMLDNKNTSNVCVWNVFVMRFRYSSPSLL